MFRLLPAMVALGACLAYATGEIRIWCTPSYEAYGLTNPNLAFKPSLAITSDDNAGDYRNNFDADFYEVAAFPTYSLVPPILGPGDYAYIWVQFGPGEGANARLHQMGLGVRRDGATEFGGVDTCYYKMDNLGDPRPAYAGKRWANPSIEEDNHATFRQNPQLLVAGGLGSNIWGLGNFPPDGPILPCNLYYPGADIPGPGDRIYLLGAVRPQADAPEGTYRLAITTFDNEFQLFVDGVARDPSSVVLGSIQYIVPEPASLALWWVVSLIRRR